MADKLTLSVPNISCGHCVGRIEKALGAMEGVASVSADAGTKKVDIEIDGNLATAATVRATLLDIGYPPEAD